MGSRDSADSPSGDINSRDDSCASRDSFESISSEQHHRSDCNTPRDETPSPQPNSTNATTPTPNASLTIGGQNSAFKKIK